MLKFQREPGEGEEEAKVPQALRIKRIRTVRGVGDMQEHFQKELSHIALEEVIEENPSLRVILHKIKDSIPNSVLLENEAIGGTVYVLIELEVVLGECMLIRGKKFIASGSMEQMRALACDKIQREYPSRFDTLKAEEIDEAWLKNFSQVHYQNPAFLRIIEL